MNSIYHEISSSSSSSVDRRAVDCKSSPNGPKCAQYHLPRNAYQDGSIPGLNWKRTYAVSRGVFSFFLAGGGGRGNLIKHIQMLAGSSFCIRKMWPRNWSCREMSVDSRGLVPVRSQIQSFEILSGRLMWFDMVISSTLQSFIFIFVFQDEGNDLPYFPPTKENRPSLYIVPSGIRPAMQRTAIEVLCRTLIN